MGRAILLLHGFTGHRAETRRLFTRMSRFLLEAGLPCATLDFRGHGESSGEFEDLSVTAMLEDARAALGHLRGLAGPIALQFSLLGFSMGGFVASLLAGERPEGLRGVTLWASVAQSHNILRSLLRCSPTEALEKMRFPLTFDGWRLGRRFLEEVRETAPARSLARGGVPVLICHARDDKTTAVENAHEFGEELARAGIKYSIEIAARGGHVFSDSAGESRIFGATRDFLVNSLVG